MFNALIVYGCLEKRMQSNELLHICKVVIITIADLGLLAGINS